MFADENAKSMCNKKATAKTKARKSGNLAYRDRKNCSHVKLFA
jgi:hypothetical protein